MLSETQLHKSSAKRTRYALILIQAAVLLLSGVETHLCLGSALVDKGDYEGSMMIHDDVAIFVILAVAT